MKPLMFELIGWVALLLNVWGNLALVKKSNSGWIIRLVCNVAWVAYSIFFAAWPLLANHLIFAGINYHGWWKWKAAQYICPGCGREYDLDKNQHANCVCEKPLPGNALKEG
jgi:hypothetical protein